MKLKKWWGFSALMLTGVGVAIPIALTTSCAEKKDWTFNNYNEVDNYLQKHKQDVSEAYIFSSTVNETDYEFIKKNVNLQLFINSFSFYFFTGDPHSKIELHIKNKTTVELDWHQTTTKLTITYDNFVLTLKRENAGEARNLNYDFKTVVSETHYYALSLAPYALGQNLMFHSGTEENTIPLFLSPYDWTNHFLFGSVGEN